MDPFGSITIGTKISLILGSRLPIGFSPIITIINPILSEYIINDDETEMQPTFENTEIKNVYAAIVEGEMASPNSRIACDWVNVSVPPGKKGSWEFPIGNRSLFGTAWWLGGSWSVDVREQGNFEAHCNCEESKCWIRNRNVSWEWYDNIDAKSFAEQDLFNLFKNHWKVPATWLTFFGMTAEGLWDIMGDKIMRTEFKVRVQWEDNGGQMQVIGE